MRRHLGLGAVILGLASPSCGGEGTTAAGSTGGGVSSSATATTATGAGGSGGAGGSSSSSGSGGSGGEEAAPPRALSPLSTSTVTSQTPTFRWELPAGWTGARVEICTERTCAVAKTLDAVGTSAKPSNPLSPGVWFYRIFGRDGSTIAAHHGPVWQFTVGARSAPVDTSFGATLDVNGDGFADAAVGAPGGAGAVHVYHGGAAGLAIASSLTLAGTDGAGAAFGAAIASAGDVNGDGYADLLVGEPGYPGGGNSGRVFVHLGGSAGIAATPARTIESPAGPGGSFGASLTSVGDVNGDGFADVLLGAPTAAGGAGRAFLFLGGPDGLGADPSATLKGADTPGESYGVAVASAGDVNGDGYGDVLVGAYDPATPGAPAGQVRLYLGGAAGLAAMPASVLSGPGAAAGDGFGLGLATPGDLNGDGYADPVIGAPLSAMGAGRAHVFLGGVAGPGAAPSFTLKGTSGELGAFGRSLSASGDVNHDGYADLLVSEGEAFAKQGRAHLFEGSNTGPNSVADVLIEAPVKSAGAFGAALAIVGDIDRDGHDDVVIGAPGVASGDGEAYAFKGSANGSIPVAKPVLKAPAVGGAFGAAVAR